NSDTGRPRQPVLVFNDHDRSMGLMVDEIIDVVEDRLNIELSGARLGLLGSAVIAGHATDVIDTGYWLTQAWKTCNEPPVSQITAGFPLFYRAGVVKNVGNRGT